MMQATRPSQVPEYLRSSKFFLGLNVAEDDEFSIPSNHMKLNMNVDTLADMIELLNTIRFWGIDVFPRAMIDFAARRTYTAIRSVLEPYSTDLQVICAACRILFEAKGSNTRLEKAMDSGNIDIVKYFHKKGVYFTTRAIALAAGKGALDCLQYAIRFRNKDATNGYSVFFKAVCNGHVECILYLQQKGFTLPRHPFHNGSMTKRVDLAEIAAASGQCEVLKYLHSRGCFIGNAAIAAADAGHWDCLEYAIQKGATLDGENHYSAGNLSLAQRLARANLLKLFPLALSRAGHIDVETTLNFAKAENWEMFKLCIQYITRPTLDIIFAAAEQGYVECLQRLHEVCVAEIEASGNGQDWLTYAASNSTDSHNRLSPNDLAMAVVNAEQWECVRFLITHGCPMNKPLTTHLVQANQLELYLLATAQGCEVSVQAACNFARVGNVELLQHALEHGCERSEEILRAAARHGQLQCLMYAHAQGCPWSSQVTLAAARGGHQTCLQYLNEHGCPSHARADAFKRKHGILD